MRNLLFSIILAATTYAAPLTVTTSGTFSSSIPASSLTTPGASWSLSFVVDSQPAVSNVSIGNGFDIQYSDFQYLVGGTAVSLPVADIRFFAGGAPGGLLSVCFQTECPGNAPPATAIVFEGEQAYSGTESDPLILAGSYTPALEGIRDGSLRQILPATLVSITPAIAPEPTSLAMVISGLAFTAIGLRKRQTRGKR